MSVPSEAAPRGPSSRSVAIGASRRNGAEETYPFPVVPRYARVGWLLWLFDLLPLVSSRRYWRSSFCQSQPAVARGSTSSRRTNRARARKAEAAAARTAKAGKASAVVKAAVETALAATDAATSRAARTRRCPQDCGHCKCGDGTCDASCGETGDAARGLRKVCLRRQEVRAAMRRGRADLRQ